MAPSVVSVQCGSIRNGQPDVVADECPDAKPNELPHAKPNELTHAEPNELSDAEPNEFPDAESNEFPDAESNEFPHAEPNEFADQQPYESSYVFADRFSNPQPNGVANDQPHEFTYAISHSVSDVISHDFPYSVADGLPNEQPDVGAGSRLLPGLGLRTLARRYHCGHSWSGSCRTSMGRTLPNGCTHAPAWHWVSSTWGAEQLDIFRESGRRLLQSVWPYKCRLFWPRGNSHRIDDANLGGLARWRRYTSNGPVRRMGL